MTLTARFEPRDDYLHAVVSGTFTPEAGIEAANKALAAAVSTGLRRIVVDVTGFEESASAMNKVAWAMGVEQAVALFGEAHGFTPRIGIFGNPPFVEPYTPGIDYLETRSIPVRAFGTEDEALAWVDGVEL